MTRRLAAKIAYLGEDFSGSQRQPGLRTVEGEVLRCLSRICQAPEEHFGLKAASRTDRGVNALGNVVVFSTDFPDPSELMRALNAVSEGVYFRGWAEVPSDFNPRFADERVYRYILPAEGLDVAAARDCARVFLGEHDFRSFCREDGRPTVVSVDGAEVSEEEGFLVLTFRARHYLWNMIRRISAAIDAVARGQASPEDVAAALEGSESTFGVARAAALTLLDIVYGEVRFEAGREGTFSAMAEEERFRSALRSSFFSSL
jgi:tRNA pseudouridine38-40 synthase